MMKTWIALAVAALAVVPSGRALPQPQGASEARVNIDRRTEHLKQAPALARQFSSAQESAASVLKQRVPGARIESDLLTGSPRYVGSSREFLTGAGGHGGAVSEAALAAVPAGDQHRAVKAFLNEHAALYGHDSRALNSAKVSRDDSSSSSGFRTTVWQQHVDDISVFEAVLIANVTRSGELMNVASQFLPDADRAATAGTPNRHALVARPPASASQALVTAAAGDGLNLDIASIAVEKSAVGNEKLQTLSSPRLLGSAWAKLVWLPMSRDSLRLCWQVTFTSASPKLERYRGIVDAETGELFILRGLKSDIGPASYNVYTSDSPTPFSPGWPTPNPAQPAETNRVLVTLPALDTNASPQGWVPDGTRTTSGNNAFAFRDRDFDLVPDVPTPVAVGTNRVFDFPLNLTAQPITYANASIVQLFYRANWYHDKLYQFGFTETAGNYQNNNFGRGGLEGDGLLCLVQAGADIGYSDNSFFIPDVDGVPGIVAMFVFSSPNPNRDGSLDQEVVVHELTHGTSERLVGGGVLMNALQSRGMGEGWSDFYALSLLAEPTDDIDGTYPAGGYASYQFFGLEDNYYFGIRRYPYTTDLTKNPLTFKDIDPAQADPHVGIPISPLFGASDPSEVHNQGEVWCVTLHEVRAALVKKYGGNIGNNLVLQLVTDGMKLSPVDPNFLEARDAIIQADLAATGGVNYDEIWIAFAKRGMGYSASSPPSFTTVGVVEAYDVPPDVITGVEVPIGVMRIRITPPNLSTLFYGSSNSIFVRITDGVGVTNATIVCTNLNGGTVTFKNNGTAPDAFANDFVYSGVLNVPATGPDTLTLRLTITAPGKDPSTNTVTYSIIGPPVNDMFTNAIKVPVGGAYYVSNNKLATVETNEPAHGGVTTAAKSLWWRYTATANTNLLVDAGGSDFRTILAVYTNSTLATLGQVTSAIGGLARFGPYVRFDVKSGVTYHIAVAGYDNFSSGTLRLFIAPGGQPDTNAPTVTVTTPPSGIIVSTNRLTVAGTAVEPQPNPSGIESILVVVSPAPGAAPSSTIVVKPQSLIGPLSTNWSTIVGLLPGENSIRVLARDYAGNLSAPVDIRAVYRPLEPPNDFFVNAIALTNAGLSSVNTLNASKEAGEPNHAGTAGGKSAWWKFTAPSDGVLYLNTTNSTFDTVLAVYTGDSVSNLTLVASNDDAFDGISGGTSLLNVAVRANVTYRIAVDGYEGDGGVVYLTNLFTSATVYHVTVTTSTGGAVLPGSSDVVSNGTLSLTAVPDPYFLFDIWSGALSSLNNPLSITVLSNMTLNAAFKPAAYTDGFESGGLSNIAWTTGGSKPWIVQTNVVAAGSFAARSGIITDNQYSSLIFTGNFQSGILTFDYKVSSEPNFDTLRFFIDGVEIARWSGEVGWANYATTVAAGTHTIEWRYTKDPTLSTGADAAYLDNVILPLVVPASSLAPARLTVRRLTDGTAFLDLTGQPDQTYVFQSSTDAVNWQSFSTNIALGGFTRAVDNSSRTQPKSFYRAFVPAH